MALHPSMHAMVRYAQRVLGIPHPTGRDLAMSCECLIEEFAGARVNRRWTYVPKRGRTRKEHIAISDEGTHALVDRHHSIIVTVYRPDEPVNGCWCEACIALRAPNTTPPKMPPHGRVRRSK